MANYPAEVNLELRPSSRFELIDVAERIRERDDAFFSAHRRTACCSFHTTAGYVEEGFWSGRLDRSGRRLQRFISMIRRLFPPEAGYYHDRMELRDELTDAEKRTEPVNADSHLTFMGAGLRNCVTYESGAESPIYFVDLDGVNGEVRRTRRTTLLGYEREEAVHETTLRVPVPTDHAIESFNLTEDRYGLFSRLEALLERHGVERGRVDVRLAEEERDAGLTVNEYETLLMRNDLPAALRNPLRYMLGHGKELLQDPGSIPGRARDYAVYDLVHLYNEIMDVLKVGRGVADRIVSGLSGPAFELFRLRRRVSFLVSSSDETGSERILQGQYQSPIMIQHRPADSGVRELEVTLWRFR